MKAHLRYGALSVLVVVACSGPNADLFNQSSPQPGEAGGDGKVVVSGAGSSGANTNDSNPASGGSPATADVGAAGDSSVPNNQGTAGDSSVPNNQGTAGSPNNQ